MKGIVYLDDIVKELSKEFNMSYAETEELCKKSLSHASNLTLDPEVISIVIPTIGTLHFNEKRAKALYKNNAHYGPYASIIESQLELTTAKLENSKDSVHSRNSYFSSIKKFFFPDRRERMATSRFEVYKKLEIKQNKLK